MDVSRLLTCPILFAALIAVAACSDSAPTAPPSAQAAQAEAVQVQAKPPLTDQADLEAMSDRELLIAVMGKLNALETRMEAETQAVYARVDSLMARAGAYTLLAAQGPPPGQGGNGGGNKLDSLIALIEATHLGEIYGVPGDLSGNLCFSIAPGVEFELGSHATGTGKIKGGAGVEAAGNGAKAEITLDSKVNIELAGKLPVALSYQICTRGWEHLKNPPQTTATAARLQSDAPPDAAQLSAQLEAAFARFGLGGGAATTALGGLDGLLAGDLGSLRQAVMSLPLPPKFQTLANDPTAEIANFASAAGVKALNLLCDTTLGIDVGGQIAAACQLLGQIPSLDEFFGIVTGLQNLDLGGLAHRVDDINTRLVSLCNVTKNNRDFFVNTGILHEKGLFNLLKDERQKVDQLAGVGRCAPA